jgi:hypothetical protein
MLNNLYVNHLLLAVAGNIAQGVRGAVPITVQLRSEVDKERCITREDYNPNLVRDNLTQSSNGTFS